MRLTVLATVLCSGLLAQDPREAGLPYLRNFSYRDYRLHPQNLGVAQDHRGVMYFANNYGVLEYDGASWRSIEVASGAHVRSLAADTSGTIYVGCQGDFGRLVPDPSGAMRYQSLSDKISGEEGDFGWIQSIAVAPEGVYFQSGERLFRWTTGGIKTWKPAGRFGRVYAVDGKLYIFDRDGLMHLEGDRFKLARGGALFAPLRRPFLIPRAGRPWIAVASDELFEFDGHTLRPFGDGQRFSNQAGIFHGTILPGGAIVLASHQKGIAVLSPEGKLLYTLSRASGLQYDMVNYVFADRDGGLWLALDSGISRVEAGAALSIFAEGSGLKGAVQSVARHNGLLYAATDYGLFRLRPASAHAPAMFVPLKDLKQTVWCLLSTETGLLAGAVDGVYLVDGERSRRIYADEEVYFLKRRPKHPDLIFAGGAGGLSALYQRRGQWTGLPVDGVGADDGLRELAETPDGTIWLGTEYSSVIRWPAGSARIEVLGQKHGLPEGWIKPFFVAGRLVFGTRKGLFRFDETARRFVPETGFGARFADGSREIHALAEDAHGNLWIATSEENVRLRRAGSGYETDFGPLGLTAGSLAENIHVDPDGAVWVGTLEGIIRYDPSARSPLTSGLRTILRSVGSSCGHASLAGATPPVLSFSRGGALRLSYATPAYSDSARNEYQVFLAGFDKESSPWTRGTVKEYTNLPGGRYEFRVKSRDVYGRVGEEASFAFTVSQPWHRTWWAIGLGLAAGFALLYAAVRGRVQLLEARTRRLEAVVARRTLELSHKNEELVMLNHEKNEFLGMAAHDLKNPLSAIRGYAEEILEDHASMSAEEKLEYVGSMHKAAGRMVDLVTNLLDVNRIERGALELLIEPIDLADAAARTVKAYELRAHAKQIRLHFEALADPAMVMADPRYVLQILDNLISNAVKYSPQGREVHVRVRAETSGVLAEVRDQGPGLSQEDQRKLFQKFQRLSAKPTGGESSTGLGLTIVKRLVETMKGRVWCESAPGQGAAFYVELPAAARS